jgi:hypothetical protein
MDEHISLVQKVFLQLQEQNITGIKYVCYRTADNAFTHIAQFEDESVQKKFTSLSSFQEFRENLETRILDKPVSKDLTEIGWYNH